MLWEEYRDGHPDGYGYSRFCDLFREFERRLSPVMRQHHAAGDKVFVDYSGKKIGIVDPETGVVREAEIFVAVLGASNYTYAEATWTQTLPDWIGAHVRGPLKPSSALLKPTSENDNEIHFWKRCFFRCKTRLKYIVSNQD